jgi:hypothetical protein
MAYMNQERKKPIEAKLKPLLKEYGVKGSLKINNHSTLVLTIREGRLDFESDYLLEKEGNKVYVNPYYVKEHFVGESLEFLAKALEIMNAGNWDKSDTMTDYFNVGWYVDVHIGTWEKPYQVTGTLAAV